VADKLTPKQERFVQEYLVDLNATAAAKRAGYSEKAAYSIGQENLKKPEIQSAIQTAMDLIGKRTGITQERVLQELEIVAFADAHDYLNANLKVGNKLKALEMIGRHLGMFDGKSNLQNNATNNLLQAILGTEEIETSDLPEVE